jgi:cold shock CspA family protein
MNQIKGTLKRWNEDRGFGFIVSDNETQDIFIHISALKNMSRRPIVGDVIYFQIQTDKSGKRQANNARIEGVQTINKKSIKNNKKTKSSLVAICGIILIITAGYYIHSNHFDLSKLELNNLFSSLSLSKDQISDSSTDELLNNLYKRRLSNVQVKGEGLVARLLSDDNEGSKHQRFILKLASGQTLLLAHNTDLAPPINGLRRGDSVIFFGEYAWNSEGGIIHWTHRDPDNIHTAGWLEHRGEKYQ